MNKKWFMVLFSMILTIGILAGCSGGKDDNSAGGDSKSEGKGSVYYLNFKPEIADQIEQMAKDFEKETGIKVTMTTAAGGTYESTLKAEISKSDAPTIFFINGPIGYQNWKDYTLDLSDTDLNEWLLDKDLAIKGEDGGVYGIPIAVEGYGIIYNKSIMEKYFASANKSTDYKSMEEIKNFDALKAVAEDMTKLKSELGIDGVFSSTSLASGDQWRWTTHTANLPIYYEYKDKNVKELDKVDFTYADQYKNIFDLYINNSSVKPTLLGSKTTDDSMAEFALGKSAMVQNGNWAWNQIANVDGNVVKAEDIGFLPIYTGVKGEEKQGLAIGTENYLAINAKASKEDIEASKKFVDWMFNSEKGKDYVVNKFGFIPTFSTFGDDEIPTDPLAQAVITDMNNADTTAVDWNFVSFPSENFKNEFGNSLLLYAQGQAKWNTVVDTFVKSWESEMSLKK